MGALRIGVLIDRWKPARGGAERALAALVSHLEERGHRVAVFALSGDAGAPGELRRVRLGTLTALLGRGHRIRALASALEEAAEREGCDATIGIRHLHRVDLYWPHGGSHAASLLARRCAREGRVPSRSSDELEREAARARGRHRVFLELERELLEGGGARRVVCVSDLVREELARVWPASESRLEVIPNGVDLERFHPRRREEEGARLRTELGLGLDRALIAFAARRPEQKGLPTLLQALASMTDRSWHLLVAGPARAQLWRRRAVAAGLPPERVTVRSEVDPPALWSAADLCVHPTWRDTCALVVLESLASGTPVITTREAGGAEAIVGTAAGEVLDHPGDRRALAGAVGTWLDRIEAGGVQREAVRSAGEVPDQRAALERLEGILEELARA